MGRGFPHSLSLWLCRLRAWRGVLLLFLLLAGGSLLLRWLAPQSETITQLMDAYMPEGVPGALWYTGASAILICLAVPRQLLSFAGGYAFGPIYGAILATLGVTLGCVLAFGSARCLGRRFIERRYGDRAALFNRYATHRPFALAVLIRFFPSGNNLLFSLLAGVSRIPPLPFFLGSCLGYIPQNILFAMLGSGMRVDSGWQVSLGVALFAVSCLLAWYLYRQCFAGTPLNAAFAKKNS